MPLKPDVARFLEVLAGLGGAPLESLDPDQARAAYRVLGAGAPVVPDVVVEDLQADGPNGSVPLRSYRPSASDTSERPGVLVWFHGGGWVVGDLDTADHTCRTLAVRSGCCVVSVDYRRAPEHPYPAAVDDAVSALRWVHDHADELAVDAARLAVGGDSAGGSLAAVTTQVVQAAHKPRLAFQLLVYPAVDLTLSHPSVLENGEGHLLTKATMAWFVHCYIGGRDATHPRLSPLRAGDLRGLPPALVITAEYDPLRDEGEAYAAALQAADVPTRLARYDGQIHGFVELSHLFADGDDALSLAAAALAEALSA